MACQCPICDIPINRMFRNAYHVLVLHNMSHVGSSCNQHTGGRVAKARCQVPGFDVVRVPTCSPRRTRLGPTSCHRWQQLVYNLPFTNLGAYIGRANSKPMEYGLWINLFVVNEETLVKKVPIRTTPGSSQLDSAIILWGLYYYSNRQLKKDKQEKQEEEDWGPFHSNSRALD